MDCTMKFENKLEGDSNFIAWKTMIDIIISNKNVLYIVKHNVVEMTNNVGKDKLKEVDNIVVGLIMDSIIYHLIPYILTLDTSKKMYDALTSLFTINSIG